MHVLRASLILALGALAGCATPRQAPDATILPATASPSSLRPGDSLTIAIIGVPDPSTNNVQIDEQRLISLPYIGTVSAAGATSAELTTRIRQSYVAKKIYTSVDVSVSVTDRFVYVGGEVEHPGRIVWTRDLTAAKAIQAAGGFTLYAKQDHVGLVRDQKVYTLNVKLSEKRPSGDPHLEPGDSIQVPRSAF